MKKVGKELKKTLSAILVAAMVFTSLPQTTLVANAEEADQQVYDVVDYGAVEETDSKTVDNPQYDVKNASGQAVSNVSVTATVVENDTNYYVSSASLTGTASAVYRIVSVGGKTATENIKETDWYVFAKSTLVDGKIPVTVEYVPKNITTVDEKDAELTKATVTFTSGTTGAGTEQSPYMTVENTSIKFKVALKENVNGEITKVEYQIGSGAKTGADKFGDGYIIRNLSNQINDDVKIIVTVAAAYPVTVTTTGAVTSSTVKYAPTDADSADDFKTLTSGTKLQSGNYYIAVDAGAGNVVSKVNYKTGTEGTGTDVTNTSIVDGLTVYTVTVGAGATTLTITTATATQTVDVDASGEGIDGVYYLTSATEGTEEKPAFSENTFTRVSGNKIALDSTVKHLYVYVKYATNYTEDAVEINGKKAETAAGGVYEVALTGLEEGKKPGFKATAKKIEQTITFNAVGSKDNIHGKVVVEPDNIIKVDSEKTGETVEITTANKILTVNQGEKIRFRVTVDEGYVVTSVKQGETDVKKYVVGTDTYYEVEIGAENAAVAVVIEEIEGKTVTFESNTDINKISQIVDGGQAEEVSFTTSPVNVKYNGSYKFEIKSYNRDIMTVDKVSYSVDGTTFTKLEPASGVYTIDKVTENVTIKIVTKLDTTKVNAFSVEFNADELNAAVTADKTRLNAKGETVVADIVSGTTYYVVGNDADNKVNLTITPKAGLKETVTGATYNESSKKYVIDFGTEDNKAKVGKSVAVKVTTAVDTDVNVDKNQFVEFTGIDEYTTLNIADATKLTEAGYENKSVYEISKDKKEVAFTLTVPYGRKLNYTPDNAVVFQTKEPEVTDAGVVYSYKIVVSQVKSSEKTSPCAIAIGASVVANVTINFTAGSDKVKAYYYRYDENLETEVKTQVTNGASIVVGTEIFIEVTDADYKLVQTVDGKDVDIELDAYGKYSFIIDKAVTFKVVPKVETPVVEKDYDITVNKVTLNADEEEVKTSVDLTAVEVLANEKFELTAKNATTQADVKLTKAEFAGEEVKSTISLKTLAESKNAAAVTISAEDAGKTLTVNLYADEVSASETKKDVLVGTVEFKVAKAVASATVKEGKTAIKNGGKVTKEALTETIFDVTVSPETALAYFDVKVASGEAKAVWVDGKKTQIKVTTPDKAETSEIQIIDTVSDKAIFSFKVETKLPALKLSKVDSLAQGFKDINLTLTADKSVQDVATGAYLYYEVTVTPQEGTDAPTGSEKKVLYYEKTKGQQSQNEVITVNAATDLKKAAWKYDFEVRLVLSKTQLSNGTAVTDPVAAGKSIKKTFATKNAYYEDKLSVTKKTTTIYTGQSNVTAAVVKFSKNASYVGNVKIQRVLDKNGVDVTDDFTVTRGQAVSTDGYEVKLGVNTNVAPGKYTVEIAADAVKNEHDDYTMYRATASLPITVVAGINSISVDDFVRLAQEGKKDVTYTIKPVGYSGYRDKAKSQKFTYELVMPENAAKKANLEKNVVVNSTNGKVTIKKGFVSGTDWSDNEFQVKITANDFADANGRSSTTVKFLVAPEIIQIGEIYAADEEGNKLGTTLTIDEADAARIIVKDTYGNIINDDVTFTPAFKNDSTNGVRYDGWLNVAKAGNMTVKATTTDGGKKSATLKLTIKNKEFTSMSYDVYSNDTTVVETAQNQWNYKATTTPALYLKVYDGVESADTSYYNYSIKIAKGGTLVDTYSDGIKFIPTAKETKIAIKVGKTTKDITITNDTYPTDKAPKATTKDKLYKGLFEATYRFENAVPQTQTLTYTVNSDKYTKVNVTAVGDDPYGFGNNTYTITDQKFDLITNSWIGTDKYYNSAKYVFVYGDVVDGNFIPATQPANVTIKATATAAFKPVTSYKINPATSKTITLTGKPANVDVMYYDLQNANVGGQPNKFLDLFTLNGNKLEFKDDAEAKEALKDKANYTGYVTYEYVNTSGDPVVKTTKITVSFDSKAPKYTADAVDVLKGATTEATTTIKLNKNAVAISAATGDIKTATEGWTVSVADAANGKITLKYTGTETGKQTVDVKFITAASANAGKGATAGFDAFDKVSVTVNVIDPATSSKKIEIVKKTVDLNSKDVVKSYTNGAGAYALAVVDAYKVLTTGTVVENMVVDTKNAPEGITVSYAKETKTTTFTVAAKDLKANKKISVPVKVTFENNAAPETYVFTVVTPKTIPTVKTVTEAVKAYVASFHRTGGASAANTDKATIETALNNTVIDGVTGIKAAVTAKYVDEVKENETVKTPASYTVDVTLTVPGATEPVKLENLKVLDPVTPVTEQDLNAAKTAVAGLISKIVSSKTEAETEKKLATELNTRFALRAYLETAITNDDIMLQITDYEYVAPVDGKDGTEAEKAGTNGSLTFKWAVLTQTETSATTSESIVITAKAYVATP